MDRGVGSIRWIALASFLVFEGEQNRVKSRPSIPKHWSSDPVKNDGWGSSLRTSITWGFPSPRSAAIETGGTLFEGRSQFRVATFGKIQQVTTAGTAMVNQTGALERFDFVMLADQVRLVARGEIKGKEIVMEVDQTGQSSTLRFPITKPPHVGMSLESAIRQQELAVGLHLFSPLL